MEYKIKEIAQEDYEAIEALLNEGFYTYPKDNWIKRFSHWFEDNPTFLGGNVRGFILLFDQSTVGVIFTIPSELKTEDQIFSAINISTWYVKKEHRKKSLELLFKALNNKECIYFSTTIVADQMKITEIFGFKKYLEVDKIRAKMIPLNPINIGLYRICNKRIDTPTIQKLGGWIYGAKTRQSVFELKVGIQESHDAFVSNIESKILTNKRDRETIEWLIRSPFRKVIYIGIFLKGNQVGMMLWKYISVTIEVLECIDFAIIDRYKSDVLDHLNAIIKNVIDLIESKIDMVLIPQTCGIFDLSKIKGTSITRQAFNNKYYMTKNSQIASILNNKDYYFSNQGDMNL